MSSQAIGVFDSGVGGLSVLKALQQQHSKETFIYVADSAYAPYGLLPQHVLEQRFQFLFDFFIEKKVKAIVIACNTATAAMPDVMRNQLNIPVVALEPAIKPACQQTKNGNIGVFATENTLRSNRYKKLIHHYAGQHTIFESPCLGFVEQVEKGELHSAETRELIKKNIQPMLESGIDTLVLGCTHYPFLKDTIRSVSSDLGHNDILILDTANAVAKQLRTVLEANQIEKNEHRTDNAYADDGDSNTRTSHTSASAPPPLHNTNEYYTTDDIARYSPIFRQLMQIPIELKKLA